MDWIVSIIIASIAVFLAARRSSYLVDYVVVIYVFNRGLRRVLDYYAGSFNPFSPVSLTPVIITGVMLLPFLVRFGTLPKTHKTIFYCLFIAIGYSFAIGFFRIQFAAVYHWARSWRQSLCLDTSLPRLQTLMQRIAGCVLPHGARS